MPSPYARLIVGTRHCRVLISANLILIPMPCRTTSYFFAQLRRSHVRMFPSNLFPRHKHLATVAAPQQK